MEKVILYNPPNGSKIEDFIYANVGKLEVHEVGQLKYYDKEVADALLKTFLFLESKTPIQAQQIKEEAKNIKCPDCEITFGPTAKATLETHMKTHQKDDVEQILDPDIPQVKATPVEPLKSPAAMKQDELTAGPEFYGPGLTVDR